MAVFGHCFAAKEDGFLQKAIFGKLQFNLPGAHEGEKGLFINFPAAFLLLECVKNLLRGREQRFVLIVRGANLAEKIGQVGGFRESG